MQKKLFSFLIIYILFPSGMFCQNLHLKISGDNEIENQVVDSIGYLNIHKDYASIIFEVDTIRKVLYRTGYIENRLDKINTINDSTFAAQIHLKKKYDTIYIYYDKTFVEKSVLNAVSKHVFDTYFIVSIKDVESALSFINSKTTEQGFPFSKLHLSNIEIENHSNLRAHLILDPNERKRTINNIEIKGYEKFPKSYLKHYLKIKPTQTFNLNAIKRKTEQLNDLRFANQIKAPEVLFSKDSTTLYMYIEKSKSNSFDGFIGFGNNEETSKIEFNGYLNLNLINNLNYGESFSLQYKSDQNDQKTFQTNIAMPYIFNSPIGINLELYIFKKDSSFTTVNQSAKLFYQINSKHKIYTGIKTTQSNNLLTENLNTSIADYDSKYYTFAYQFIKTQRFNMLFPINSTIYFETGFGKRKVSDISEKQTQLTFDAFKIINLNQNNSIYLRVNSSSLISNTYFENELSRFGGINSIRGFEENSLLATSYGLINSEYRFQISNTIYIHSIIDLAYLENKITTSKEKLFGYGLGFGILSKAGLFKLNYANGKSENQKFKFSNSKIHLSLIADF